MAVASYPTYPTCSSAPTSCPQGFTLTQSEADVLPNGICQNYMCVNSGGQTYASVLDTTQPCNALTQPIVFVPALLGLAILFGANGFTKVLGILPIGLAVVYAGLLGFEHNASGNCVERAISL